jgi:tRNA threonylcarbamoyladenosine biosynthesis protein TsaB
MNTLAFDTCCGRFSIALFKAEELVQYYLEHNHNQQSRNLLPMIKDLLAQNKLTVAEIDNIIITLGPGSFTGVRIGMAAAQGMALINNARLIGISTLEALAYMQNGNIVTVLEAGRGHYYAQLFHEQTAKSKIWLADSEEILQLSKNYKVIGAFQDSVTLPDARFFIKALKTNVDETKELMPIYIREPDVKIANKLH